MCMCVFMCMCLCMRVYVRARARACGGIGGWQGRCVGVREGMLITIN